jgi:hypothetical protein
MYRRAAEFQGEIELACTQKTELQKWHESSIFSLLSYST